MRALILFPPPSQNASLFWQKRESERKSLFFLCCNVKKFSNFQFQTPSRLFFFSTMIIADKRNLETFQFTHKQNDFSINIKTGSICDVKRQNEK